MLTLASLRQAGASSPKIPRPLSAPSARSCWIVFLLLWGLGLGYACTTQHAWEDYYITYRASKNLATGHGLTFTVGERVHSFTSPLGALLPAVASLLTGNRSDEGALWIFRLMSISAYAGAGVILWRIGRGLFSHRYPAVLLVGLLATDAKAIEFVTDGMETGFVLLFLVWTIYALLLSPRRRAVHLGLAWAGMMWSRPDSFVYIGALTAGVFLFGRFTSFWGGRRELLRDCLIAGAITTLVYGPWLVWAWWYYGSPIPHTIIAKSLWVPRPTVSGVFHWILDFPFKIARNGATLPTTFMPPYGVHNGWPMWAIFISRYLSVAVLLVWVMPFVRWEARVASFAFTLGHFYLTYFANFPAPWYLPTLTTLGFVTLAVVFSQLVQQWPRRDRSGAVVSQSWRPHWLVLATTSLVPLGALLLTLGTSRQMRLTQQIIEDQHRRPMAEWIKANASSPRDTVMVECLGYVGYFSNLKMYDYPGLSSPEVVDVLRRTKTRADYIYYFQEIATALAPDWVVLRGSEAEVVMQIDPLLLTRYYRLVRVFDTCAKIDAIRFLPGRGHLTFDSRFQVYRRNEVPAGLISLREHVPGITLSILFQWFTSKKTWTGDAYESGGNIVAHAPSLLTFTLPPEPVAIRGEFGFFPGSFERPNGTEGAIFKVNVVSPSGVRTTIFSRQLNPRDVEADRGAQSFEAAITMPDALTAEFVIDPPPGKSNAFDWTYWSKLGVDIRKKK